MVERELHTQHGWHTNSSYAGLACRANSLGVIPLCHRSGAEVQCKESMGIISAPLVTSVTVTSAAGNEA